MRPLTLCAPALALALVPSVSAAAARPAHVTRVEVHGTGGPGSGLYGFRVDISASRAAGRAPRGTFRGTIAPGSGTTSTPDLVTLAGPVTCLQVTGRTASLLYPLSAVTTAAGSQSADGMSILITVTQGVGGAPSKMGFMGPLPTSAFKGACAPGSTPFVVEGTVRVSP